jgi:WD40 repeat protein
VEKPVEAYAPHGQLELSQSVEATSISPDGLWIAAGTTDGKVHVWSRDRNQEPLPPLPYGRSVRSVAIGMDAQRQVLLAVVGTNENSSVKVWRFTQNGPQPAAELKVEQDRTDQDQKPIGTMHSVVFSSDGSRLLTAGADGAVGAARLWQLSTGKVLHAFWGHQGPVWSARFSPDEQSIVTAGDDQTVRIWSINSASRPASNTGNGPRERVDIPIVCRGHVGPVYAAEFSRDGQYIVSGGQDRRLLVWDVSQAGSATVNAKSRTAEIEEALRAQSVPERTWGQAHELGRHDATIRAIAFTPGGQRLASAGHDSTIRVWDFAAPSALADAPGSEASLKDIRLHSDWIHSCSFYVDPSQREWILSGGYDGRVLLGDWQKYERAHVLRDQSERDVSDNKLVSAEYSVDGKWIVTASEQGVVTMWDLDDPDKPRAQRLREGHAGLATTGILFDGDQRLLTAGGDNTACVWDRVTGRQLLRLGTGWYEKRGTGWRGLAAVSHDGRLLATGSDEDLARIWNAESGGFRAVVGPQPTQTQYVALGLASTKRRDATALAFAPNNRILFVGDDAGHGYFVDDSGQVRADFSAHAKKITAAVFADEGRSLLTSSADGMVYRWNLNGQPERSTRYAHNDRVLAMAVSRDGKLLLTATAAGTDDKAAILRLWNLQDGTLLKGLTLSEMQQVHGTLPGEKLVVTSVDFHPNGKHAIVTVFSSGDPNTPYDLARWDWKDDKHESAPYRKIVGRADFSAAKYSRDGKEILAVGGRGARTWAVDAEGVASLEKVTMNYRLQNVVNSAAFSPDSRTLVVAGADGIGMDGTVKIWTLNAQRQWSSGPKIQCPRRGPVRSAVFHPTRNDLLLTAHDDGTADLWQRDQGDNWQRMVTFGDREPHKGAVNRAVLSPDGSRVMTLSDDRSARLWTYDLATKQTTSLGEPLEHDAPVVCGDFSSDGNWIVTGNGHNAAIWHADWNTNDFDRAAHGLEGHSQEITNVAFSLKDASRVLTASRDFTVRLWDTSDLVAKVDDLNFEKVLESAEFKELLALEEHTGEVVAASFSPHDERPEVLTAAKDGQAIIWPSEPVEK